MQLVRLTREGEEKRRVFGIPSCAKIRDNELYWLELEKFVRNFISFRSKSADIERRSFEYKCGISKATRKMQDGKNFHLRFPFVGEEEDIGKKEKGGKRWAENNVSGQSFRPPVHSHA